MSDFQLAIKRWCDKAGSRVDAVGRAFVMLLIERVQERTPVLTGRLRASIQPLTPLADWYPSKGQSITIGTNAEYARRIEYGFTGQDSLGRSYHQTGVGMFAAAIHDAPELWKQAAAQ